MQQVKAPGKRTIFVARQIYLVARHNFDVASMVTLYHDCKTINAAINVFLDVDVFSPAAHSSIQMFDNDRDVIFMFKM